MATRPNKQADHSAHDRHEGMEMEPRATRPQVVTVSIPSLMALAAGAVLALLGAAPAARSRVIDGTLIA